MSEVVPKNYVDLAFQLADVAGSILRRHFRKTNRFLVKSDQSPVTLADKEVERTLRTLLKQSYPQHNILGEEEGQESLGSLSNETCSDYTWVLDPIDGTKAFMTGKPTFGTLIALLEGGIPILGIIDQPILRERWFGAKGYGAFYNDTPISNTLQRESCSQDQLRDCVLYATSPDMFHNEMLDAFKGLSKRVQYTLYGCDCYAYALLASGFVDLVAEADLKPWDYLALVPIIENAGGCITDWNGNSLTISSYSGCVLAARTNTLHQQALEALHMQDSLNSFHQEKMFVQSMTGFSRAQSFGKYSLVTVDLRSQNGRYLDICGTLPPMLEGSESKIHNLLKQFLCRGKVHYSVSISASEDSLPISLMEPSVKDIKQILERISQILKVQTPIDLNHVLQFRDLVIRSKEHMIENEEDLWPCIEEAFHKAIRALIEVQRQEGERLVADIETRIELLRGWLDEIDQYAPTRVVQQKRRMKQRIEDCLEGNHAIDESRLDQELALLADRIDITEETVRFRSHLNFFTESLKVAPQVGRRLNFICQEWLREANTITAKCADSYISTKHSIGMDILLQKPHNAELGLVSF
ncbi:Bifunctional phosphatase IMPL2, chloroplastic [Galdieria sulphuraria]|nr:Bifunctional phosphatase IMPL2, chloroplastic [Galdieria sulphuraria]